jgi:hypothetical protein
VAPIKSENSQTRGNCLKKRKTSSAEIPDLKRAVFSGNLMECQYRIPEDQVIVADDVTPCKKMNKVTYSVPV